MVKVEYGDFYKFLASLGVTIVGGTLLLDWLFLKESFSWLNQLSQNNQNTPNIQAFLKKKESILLDFMNYFGVFTIIAITVGIIFLIAGLVFWLKNQKEIDKQQKLTNQKMEKELQDMTSLEVIQSAANEIEENTPIFETNSNNINITSVQDGINVMNSESQSLNGHNKLQIMQEYLKIEDLIFKKVSAFIGDNDVLLRNKKINSVEFDMILKNDRDNLPDFIFEVKYYKSKDSIFRLKQEVSKLYMASEVYRTSIQRMIRPVLFVVLSNEAYDEFRVKRVMQRISENPLAEKVDVIIVNEENLINMSSDDIKKELRFDRYENIA